LGDVEFGLRCGFLILLSGRGGLILGGFGGGLCGGCCRGRRCELGCWNEPRYGFCGFRWSFFLGWLFQYFQSFSDGVLQAVLVTAERFQSASFDDDDFVGGLAPGNP
jgi:hypothetical protein